MPQPELLIAEDDTEMAVALQRGFELTRHSVTLATNGEEALRLARHKHFEAIILDVMLPLCDGFAVAATLRGTGDRTPILMLTARDSVEDIVRGFDCGAEDYLTKPFSFLELSARVRALIRRNQPESQVLEVADLRLDIASRQVWRGGQPIHLTPTEFRLLEILLRNTGYVVRRAELMESVWPGCATADNNIDVAVSALRGKIDRQPTARLIRTVRGFGYRLAEPE